MTFGPTVLLGAIAGFTIYLGLPFARLPNPPRAVQAFLNALATGILLFLLGTSLPKRANRSTRPWTPHVQATPPT